MGMIERVFEQDGRWRERKEMVEEEVTDDIGSDSQPPPN